MHVCCVPRRNDGACGSPLYPFPPRATGGPSAIGTNQGKLLLLIVALTRNYSANYSAKFCPVIELDGADGWRGGSFEALYVGDADPRVCLRRPACCSCF